MEAEINSLRDRLHQEELRNSLQVKEFQNIIRSLEEKQRRLENRLKEREIEAQELSQALKQYRTKAHKLSDKVIKVDECTNCTI